MDAQIRDLMRRFSDELLADETNFRQLEVQRLQRKRVDPDSDQYWSDTESEDDASDNDADVIRPYDRQEVLSAATSKSLSRYVCPGCCNDCYINTY